MTEREFAEFLMEVLSDTCHAQRFYDAGVMTLDEGIVVSCPDGEQFQLTIKRSR